MNINNMRNIINEYSLLHFCMGIMIYFVGMRLRIWFIVHIVFSLMENKVFKNKNDNLKIIITNQVLALLGWYVAYCLDEYGYKNGWYVRHLNKKLKF